MLMATRKDDNQAIRLMVKKINNFPKTIQSNSFFTTEDHIDEYLNNNGFRYDCSFYESGNTTVFFKTI